MNGPQVWLCTFALLAVSRAGAEPAEMLARRCDLLLQEAVQRPYGWAWPAAEQPTGPMPRGAKAVDVRSSAGMGLMLLDAADELNNEEYQQAAYQAARGILASQQPNGRIPARAIFSAGVSVREPPTQTPDRAPTCAALGLLLSLLEDRYREDAVLRAGAAKAAHWLMRQQAANGLWPTADRQVRLDGPDYRNCTMALLAAGATLDDRVLRQGAKRAVDALLRLRLEQSKSVKGLWQAAYELNMQPSELPPQYARAVDVLASRYAVQTLIATCAAQDSPAAREALEIATTSLAALCYEDGKWERMYPLQGIELAHPVKGPTPHSLQPFATTRPRAAEEVAETGPFGLPEAFLAARRIKEGGGNREWKRDVARVLVGAVDEGFGLPPLRQ